MQVVIIDATVRYENDPVPELTIMRRIKLQDNETLEDAIDRVAREACHELRVKKLIASGHGRQT